MCNIKYAYCRLCADLKNHNEFKNMQTDEETCQKVVNKLSRFNIVMNFQENILPKTVCLPCVKSLEQAFTFVTAVEQAQAFLSKFILTKTSTLNHNDCDHITFVLPTETDKQLIDVKDENSRDPMDVNNDETYLGEDCDDENVFNNDDKNASTEKVNMENQVTTESCYVALEEKINMKDETDLDNVNIEENESLNFSNEFKYNHHTNERENDSDIKEPKMLPPFNDKLLKGLDTENNCEEIPPSKNTDYISMRRNKKKCRGTKSSETKGKQSLLKLVPPELGSTVYSEDYINKQINRLSIIPVKYLKLTWMDYEWKCSHCGTLFSNIEELQKHSIMYHSACNAYQCTDCKIKKQCLNAFIKHVRSHRKYLHYSCYKCFEKFPKTMETRGHKMKIHENSKYICFGCNTPFSSNAELEAHMENYYNILWRKKTFINTENLNCSTCNKLFANLTALRKHLYKHKLNKRDHICDRCGKCFDSEPSLRSHMDIHSERNLYQCEICKATFKTVYTLRYHSSIHSGIKPFTCDVCNKCFRTKSQIKDHMKYHSDSYPFPCTVCSKKFRTDNILQNHMHQHTGAKPFSCNICPRDFTNLSNRNKHMRLKHGIEMAKKRQPFIKQLTADEPSLADLATEEAKSDLDKMNEWKNTIKDHRKSQKCYT